MQALGTRPAATALWAVAGGLWALALLGLASIGVYVAPVALLATVLTFLTYGRSGSVGFPVGAATVGLALLVPFLLT